MLSNQRVWKDIALHLTEIDEIFCHYQIENIKKMDATIFSIKIKTISCGNRKIDSQMAALKRNVEMLEKIHPEMENAFTEYDYRKNKLIAKEWQQRLCDPKSEFKIIELGPTLAYEFLRNIGISAMKPDTHLLRILGKKRLGVFSKIESEENMNSKEIDHAQEEFLDFCSTINNDPAYPVYVDNLVWMFGATKYGEICTAIKPRCEICELRKNCNFEKTDSKKTIS